MLWRNYKEREQYARVSHPLLDPYTTVTWGKSRPAGGGGGTSSTDGKDSSTMIGRGEA